MGALTPSPTPSADPNCVTVLRAPPWIKKNVAVRRCSSSQPFASLRGLIPLPPEPGPLTLPPETRAIRRLPQPNHSLHEIKYL